MLDCKRKQVGSCLGPRTHGDSDLQDI